MAFFPGHSSRKRFGQHWLIDKAVLQRIIVAAELKNDDRVLEVGPGKGVLTERLLASEAAAVHVIELDRDLVVGLKERFGSKKQFTLQEGDVLSVPLTPPDGIPSNKVVANIPYNITGPLLERLIGRLGRPIETSYKLLVLLMQKEVADRILASPGQSSFSALSVRIQLLARGRRVCSVSPNCFKPPPKVQSEVIALEPLSDKEHLDPFLARKVETLLRTAFMARRKMLRNSLGRIIHLEKLDALAKGLGISLNQRPQDLAPSIWFELARGLNMNDSVVSKP